MKHLHLREVAAPMFERTSDVCNNFFRQHRCLICILSFESKSCPARCEWHGISSFDTHRLSAGDRPDSAATNILCEQAEGLEVICSNGADGKPKTSVGTMATISTEKQHLLGGPIPAGEFAEFAANYRRKEKKRQWRPGLA